jgi:hypothetical protein
MAHVSAESAGILERGLIYLFLSPAHVDHDRAESYPFGVYEYADRPTYTCPDASRALITTYFRCVHRNWLNS